MTRKYQDIRVLSSFYVNSQGHPFFTVRWKNGEHTGGRNYSPIFGWEYRDHNGSWQGAPAYLTLETEAAIVRLLQSADARPYEYDRDGNKRFENLRYWGDEVKASIIRVCTPKGVSR